jgi:hypothetical protein
MTSPEPQLRHRCHRVASLSSWKVLDRSALRSRPHSGTSFAKKRHHRRNQVPSSGALPVDPTTNVENSTLWV